MPETASPKPEESTILPLPEESDDFQGLEDSSTRRSRGLSVSYPPLGQVLPPLLLLC